MDTGLLLSMIAGAAGDRHAVGPRTEALTYSSLQDHATAGAVWIKAQQVDNVAFIGINGHALPLAIFSAGLAGKPFAPLNYRLPDVDLRKLLGRTAPAVAIVDEDMMARVQGVEGVKLITRGDFETLCAQAPEGVHEPEEPDIAVLLFTSGTTGEPKAAVLRHRHLASYIISSVDFMGAHEEEAALVSVPPYHIAGISAVLSGFYSGRRIVYLPAFTAEAWADVAAAERITHAMVVPTMLDRVLDILEQRKETLPALKALSYGGGRMPLQVIERAVRLLPHVDFVNAYGLTETSSTISVLGPDDHREAMASQDAKVRRRLGSVGRPLPSLEVEIRGPDGEVLGPGEPGEVYVRGEQVAGEYLGRESRVRADGWFPTNDAGWMDEGGYLFLEGRLDDVIVRGGENISPGEIEDVLRTHENVADVAVFGVPDKQWGERVAAVIVPRGAHPTPEAELAEFVKTRLRSTKTPEVWEFRQDLPYNETGKLLRRVLRAELSEKVGAGA